MKIKLLKTIFFGLLFFVSSIQIFAQAETYYNGINVNDPSFVDDLKTLIRSNYTRVSYANFASTNIANFASFDNGNGTRSVFCVYSNFEQVYTPPFAWTPTTSMSREHTWCFSWMPTHSSTSTDEYADQHHLFPTHQNGANGVRSNHPLGRVHTISSTFLEGKYGKDINNNNVYEPRDAHKGDAARALLYMALRYDGINGNSWSFNWLNSVKLPALNEGPQNLDTLIAWHLTDLPDAWEISRNNYVQSIQGNRNPFVDHPEFVNYINFNDMTYAGSGGNTIVNFSASSTTVYEYEETVTISVLISNPSEDFASTVDIVLISGDASELGNYTTQTVTFPAGSSAAQSIVINISQDDFEEDDKLYTFQLQNAAGGNSISVGSTLSFILRVVDKNAVELTGNGSYFQNFNTATATVPTGWAYSESGDNANTSFSSGTGTIATGDTYFFGTANNWAFGGLRSLNLIPTIGVKFRNLTGGTINQITVSYTGETWRVGTVDRSDRLEFEYSFDAYSLTTGSWEKFSDLNYQNPGQAMGNGSIQHTANISATINDLEILHGKSFWFRWIDFNASGADDGMAVNNFSIDEVALPVELNYFEGFYEENKVKLKWSTATEINNYGFEVQRAIKNEKLKIQNWEVIGFVNGHGNSNSVKNYLFIDENPIIEKSKYRLKQIDTDGNFEYSKIIEVDFSDSNPNDFILFQNHPNPFNPVTKIEYLVPVTDAYYASATHVNLKIFDILGNEITTLVNENKKSGKHFVNFNSNEYNLTSGVYFYQLYASSESGNFLETKKMLILK